MSYIWISSFMLVSIIAVMTLCIVVVLKCCLGYGLVCFNSIPTRFPFGVVALFGCSFCDAPVLFIFMFLRSSFLFYRFIYLRVLASGFFVVSDCNWVPSNTKYRYCGLQFWLENFFDTVVLKWNTVMNYLWLGSMWDLWWTKWRWGRFSPSTSVSPANLHSTNFSPVTITYHLGLVQ
jgi:hypothetical protein